MKSEDSRLPITRLPIICTECHATNSPKHTHCSQCGAQLKENAAGEEVQSASTTPIKAVAPNSKKTTVLISVAIGAALLIGVALMRSGDNSEEVAPTPVAAPVDPNVQTLGRVKAFWNEGAEYKRRRQYAKAATAWMKAL